MGAAIYACCTVVQIADRDANSFMNDLLYEEDQGKTHGSKRASADEYRISQSRGAIPPVLPQQNDRTALTSRLVALVGELFCLQDLNADGVLEEVELVKLNEKIAMLHSGKDIDRAAVRQKYTALFREHLDAQGNPVPLETFERYVFAMLREFDPDPKAQEMILEQFIAEARSARELFRCNSFWSVSDDLVEVRPPCRRGLALSPGVDPRAVHYRDDEDSSLGKNSPRKKAKLDACISQCMMAM